MGIGLLETMGTLWGTGSGRIKCQYVDVIAFDVRRMHTYLGCPVLLFIVLTYLVVRHSCTISAPPELCHILCK